MDEQVAELLGFFKALADGNRLKIVGLLAQGEYTVEQLAEMLDLRPSTVSHHPSATLPDQPVQVSRPGGRMYHPCPSLRQGSNRQAGGWQTPWGMRGNEVFRPAKHHQEGSPGPAGIPLRH